MRRVQAGCIFILILCAFLTEALLTAHGENAQSGEQTLLLQGDRVLSTSQEVLLREQEVVLPGNGPYRLRGELKDLRLHLEAEGDTVLILDGASIRNVFGEAVVSEPWCRVTLVLEQGTRNVLESGTEGFLIPGREATGAALYAEGDLTLCGSGSLLIGGYRNNGIRCGGTLTVSDGAEAEVRAANRAVRTGNCVIGDGRLRLESGAETVYTENALTVQGGSLEADSSGHCIRSGGGVTLAGGSVRLSSSEKRGITAADMVAVSGGSLELDALEDGIFSETGIVISGGSVTVRSGEDALQVGGKRTYDAPPIRILGGEVILSAGEDPIDAPAGCTVEGGSVLANGKSLGETKPRGRETAAGGDGQKFSLIYEAGCGYAQAEVSAQAAQGSWYLFLPSSADFGAMTLRGPKEAELSAPDSERKLRLDGNGRGENLDLTALFGEMVSGKTYRLSLSWKNGKQTEKRTVLLLRSAAVSSLHVTLDTSVRDINASTDKSVSGAGYLVKLDALGRIEAEAGVEKLNGRGNASWRSSGDKKSYSIKLYTAEELIPLSGASKTWALVSDNVPGHDNTGLYNTVTMKLFEEMGGSAALQVENVDLYINGNCRGSYLLMEKPGIAEERVPVRESLFRTVDREHRTRVSSGSANAKQDELLSAGIRTYQYATGSMLRPGGEGGYLLELDFRYTASDCWFVTRRGIPVVVVEPKYAGYEQVKHIALYVQAMEDALYENSGFNGEGRHYSEYLDLTSLAVRYAADCFAADRDMFLASEYFYADIREDGTLTPLKAGPAWDFDYGDPGVKALLHQSAGIQSNGAETWMYRLLSKGDFTLELRRACADVLMPLWRDLNDRGMEEWIERLRFSHRINDLLWSTQYDDRAATYRTALKSRYSYWETAIWGGKTVQGVEILKENGGLRAHTEGKVKGYTWYRVLPEKGWALRKIEGADTQLLVPEKGGIYVVAVKGSGVAFNPALNRFSSHMVNGEYLPVAQESITLYSAPYEYD